MSAQILLKSNGKEKKAKGVIVEHKKNDIPEIIGLTLMQFFGFLFAAILLGAGSFGLGYALGFFKDGAKQVQKTQIVEKTAAQEEEEAIIRNPHYVLMGSFKTEADAQLLQEKVKNIGKKAHIKSKNNDVQFLVYLGPYASFSLAQSEIDALLVQSLNGSIIKELP